MATHGRLSHADLQTQQRSTIKIRDPRGIRTPNLLIWRQTRCRCAIEPLNRRKKQISIAHSNGRRSNPNIRQNGTTPAISDPRSSQRTTGNSLWSSRRNYGAPAGVRLPAAGVEIISFVMRGWGYWAGLASALLTTPFWKFVPQCHVSRHVTIVRLVPPLCWDRLPLAGLEPAIFG
jgi:hypothetical protein